MGVFSHRTSIEKILFAVFTLEKHSQAVVTPMPCHKITPVLPIDVHAVNVVSVHGMNIASGAAELGVNSGPEENQVEITLDLFEAITSGEALSQRSLSTRLGVALGLTNALLKRCLKKGLIKIKKAPARRYVYYVTPKGFVEKGRLTAKYLTTSLAFFRQARREYTDTLTYCEDRGWRRVALYGASELAEIAVLAARQVDVDLVAVVDPGRNSAEFCDLPVVQSTNSAGNPESIDAVVITTIDAPQEAFDTLAAHMGPERVLTPPLLYVMRDGVPRDEGIEP